MPGIARLFFAASVLALLAVGVALLSGCSTPTGRQATQPVEKPFGNADMVIVPEDNSLRVEVIAQAYQHEAIIESIWVDQDAHDSRGVQLIPFSIGPGGQPTIFSPTGDQQLVQAWTNTYQYALPTAAGGPGAPPVTVTVTGHVRYRLSGGSPQTIDLGPLTTQVGQ